MIFLPIIKRFAPGYPTAGTEFALYNYIESDIPIQIINKYGWSHVLSYAEFTAKPLRLTVRYTHTDQSDSSTQLLPYNTGQRSGFGHPAEPQDSVTLRYRFNHFADASLSKRYEYGSSSLLDQSLRLDFRYPPTPSPEPSAIPIRKRSERCDSIRSDSLDRAKIRKLDHPSSSDATGRGDGLESSEFIRIDEDVDIDAEETGPRQILDDSNSVQMPDTDETENLESDSSQISNNLNPIQMPDIGNTENPKSDPHQNDNDRINLP